MSEPTPTPPRLATAARHRRCRRPPAKVRMSSAQRREQLIAVGRHIFAEKGLDATSVEEVAARAKVSKPVVYEHFGGKEGLYAVVVDREVRALLDRITTALTAGHPRELLEQAALALLDYIEEETDGFRVLVRESPVGSSTGNFSSVLNDVAHQVEHILAREFKAAALRRQAGRALLPGAGRHGRADRPLVAGGPQAPPRDGGRAPGQHRLERPVPPGAQADPDHPQGPLTPGPSGVAATVSAPWRTASSASAVGGRAGPAVQARPRRAPCR